MRARKRPLSILLMVVVVVGVWWWREYGPGAGGGTTTAPRSEGEARAPGREPSRDEARGPADDGALARAVAQKRSKVWVESSGRIVHLLKDDRDPPRHQRCLVDVLDGHTIKISHNIDLAPRVPWRKGQRIAFRGRFEWNDKGGVVHWTHHDPKGRIEGGWLEVDGQRYR